MRWVSYWSCFLLVGVALLWVRCLKAFLGMYLRLRGRSMNLRSQESRANDNFIKLQAELHKGGNAEFVSLTRRGLAWLGVSGLVFCICVCTLWPQAEILTISNPTGEGRTEWLFGLISYPASQEPIIISSGHISLMGNLTILPCILGFYFGPSPRR